MRKDGIVFKKFVGERFRTEYVDFNRINSLEYSQEAVDGLVDYMELPNGVDIWVNDESKINGSRPNTIIVDKNDKTIDVIFGNFVITGRTEDGETIGLTNEQVDYVRGLIQNKLVFIENLGYLFAIKLNDVELATA